MLHNIAELDKNGEGYVFWKGKHVEHYSYRHDEREEEKEACQKLAGKCRKLETWNFPVSVTTAGWCWSWFENWDSLSDDEQKLYHRFFAATLGWHEDKAGNLAFVAKDDFKNHSCKIAVWNKETRQFTEQTAVYAPNQVCWHAIENLGYKTADMAQQEKLGTVYATTAGIVGFIKRHQLDKDFFEALANYLDKRETVSV